MRPEEPVGPLSEAEVRRAVARVRAFVAQHPRRNASIQRRLDDALDLLAASADEAAESAEDTTVGDVPHVDVAEELIAQVAEARIARAAPDLRTLGRLRAARDLGRDAIRALGASVLVSQEERTSSVAPGAAAPRKG